MIIIIIIIILLILFTFFEKEEFSLNEYKYIEDEPLENSKFIYCKIDGNFNNKNLKKEFLNVDTGYYNYKDNYLALLKNNIIYKINLFTNEIEKEEPLENHFSGLKNNKINCLFYFLDNVYICYYRL